MHSTRKLLWIIIFITLLQDLVAENLTESSQLTDNSSKPKNTLSVNSYDWHYLLQIAAIVIPMLVVIYEVCCYGIIATENTRDPIYIWFFWHIPRYVISRMCNRRRRFTQNRENEANENENAENENIVRMQQIGTEV